MSTITAHLRAVAAARAETDVGDLPDPVLASLRAAADALWLELAEAADARIEAVTRTADDKVKKAHEAQAVAERALADLGDERGTLVATLAARDTELADSVAAREALATEHAALERRAALEERDRAALATRLADRDAELERARATAEHADRALADATAERERLARALDAEVARREAEGAAREADLERLRDALETARTHAVTLAATEARLDAQLLAESERSRDLAARHDALRRERDAALAQALSLDERLERSRQEAAESQRAADAAEHAARALHAHVERLEGALRAAGVERSDIPLPPSMPSRSGTSSRRPGARSER